jgi:hypothetical protein
MRSVQGKIRTLLAQQSGQIQLLIIAPILTLSFLSLVVRTANSAIDPSLEKKKVNQQLKQRLLEVRGADPQRSPDLEARVQHNDAQPGSWRMVTEQSQHAFTLTLPSKESMYSWKLAQGISLGHTLLSSPPTTKPNKKTSSRVKMLKM